MAKAPKTPEVTEAPSTEVATTPNDAAAKGPQVVQLTNGQKRIDR